MEFTIINKFNTYWEVWCGPTFAAGPLGSIEEARDWVEKHSPKELETQSFYKKDFEKVTKGILERQSGFSEKLANLD